MDEKIIKKSYDKTKHKIFNLWNYIIQLTATDEELLEKINGLEKSIQILSKKQSDNTEKQWVYKVSKNYSFSDLTLGYIGLQKNYYITVEHNLNILTPPIVNLYNSFIRYNTGSTECYNETPPVTIIDSNTCRFKVVSGNSAGTTWVIDCYGSYVIMG